MGTAYSYQWGTAHQYTYLALDDNYYEVWVAANTEQGWEESTVTEILAIEVTEDGSPFSIRFGRQLGKADGVPPVKFKIEQKVFEAWLAELVL